MDCGYHPLPPAAVIAPPAVGERGAARSPASRGPEGLPGRLEWRYLGGDAGLPYLVYLPSRRAEGQPIFVTVHGISRNAVEHARLFAPFAEARDMVLVAPLFTRTRFPGYQRLERNAQGETPVGILLRIVDEVAGSTGASSGKLRLFGYSGGGQFVHRFVMTYPARVAAYVVGAAGWYTFPDVSLRYPHGLRRNRSLGQGGFDPADFLSVPGWVLVGERDTDQDDALRVSGRVIRMQGMSRLERGRRWATAMNAAAAHLGLAPAIGFDLIPRSAHSFRRSMRRGDMGRRVFALLCDEAGDLRSGGARRNDR